MRVKLAVGLVAVLATIAVAVRLARPFEVRLTEADVQRTIEAHLPLSTTHVGQAFSLDSVRVRFRPDARVGLEGTLGADVAGARQAGSLAASARLALRGDAFYLEGVQFERVELAGHERSGYGLAARAAAQLLSRHLQGRPVYRIDPRKVARAGPLLALREVRVEDGALIAVLDAGTFWRRLRARVGP